MASISANGAKGHHKFTLTVTETGTSTENNTSTVKYTFQISPVQTSWNWEQWGSSISYTINVNGTKYTGTIPAYDGYSTVTLKSGTQTVTHSSDGSKSISYSFSVTDGAGQYYTPGNASASDTLALTTIPRATTPTLSATSITVNGSNYVNITVKPASSSFKHKVRYAFGSLTGQSKGVSIGTGFSASGDVTVKFTPPVDVLRQIPDKNSATCTVSCYTYTSSGTHIGTKTVTLTFNVPSYTPTIAANLTGNKLLSGVYVQGKSTATFEIVATTSYGATIKSYSSVVDGKTYKTQKFTTSALTKGDKTIEVTVTDTRGKTNTYTSAVFASVQEYFTPSITNLTAARQSDGTTVIATVKGSIAPINNKNAKTITVTLNGVTKTITSDSYTINGSTTFTSVPTDNTFTCTAKLTDSYTNATKDVVLPTVAVTMDFHYSGKGIALGKVAEQENLLEVNWKSKFNDAISIEKGVLDLLTLKRSDSANGAAIKFANTNGGLGYIGMTQTADTGLRRWSADAQHAYLFLDTSNTKDYVIGYGSTNGWEYTKWNSGKIELFAEKSLSFPASEKQTDYLYRSIVSLDLSSLLTKIMSGTCSVQTNGMVPQVCRHSSKLTTAEIVIVTSRTFSAFTITAPIYIIGKWK